MTEDKNIFKIIFFLALSQDLQSLENIIDESLEIVEDKRVRYLNCGSKKPLNSSIS